MKFIKGIASILAAILVLTIIAGVIVAIGSALAIAALAIATVFLVGFVAYLIQSWWDARSS